MEKRNQKTVFVLIDHPNLDYLLLPVIQKLKEYPDIDVMICVYDYGNDELLKESGIAYFSDLAIFSDFLKKPGEKILLSGSSDSDLGPHQRGKRLVMACRENGIPSLAIQHASAFMYNGWTDEATSNADIIAVYGRGDYEEYRSIGVTADRLVITGSPFHDRLYRIGSGGGGHDENNSRQIGEKGAYVLYAGNADRRVADAYEECVARFNDFFNVLTRHFPHHSIMLKPHPGEEFYGTIDLYKDAAGENISKIKIADPHAHLPQLIHLSDFVISFSPSVLLESILLKKPVVYMTGKNTAMSVACEKEGATILKTSYNVFPTKLEAILPDFSERLYRPISLSDSFIERVAHKWDGRSADRIALAVEQLLSKKRLMTVDGILQDTDASGEVSLNFQPKGMLEQQGHINVEPVADESGALDAESEKVRKCLEEGNHEEAIGILKRIVEREPDSAFAHNDLGVVYFLQGNKVEALHCYEQAVRLDPKNLNLQKNLADFYAVESGRVEDGLVIYNQILKADPRDIEALMALAHICMAMEKPESARDFYHKILDIEPWNEEARIALDNLKNDESGPDVESHSVRPIISIIILAYNQFHYTKKCIESIIKNTNAFFEIILVDNGSTDGTSAYLESELTPLITGGMLRIIRNDNNHGFAAGNNQGISIARGEYILLMNNDIVVTPGWLESLVSCAERDPRIGIVGPMSNSVSGPQLVKNVPYNINNLDGLDDFAEEFSRRNAGRAKRFLRVVGFCMLIKRAVVDKIGGLDSRYGLGNFEDDDFSLRAALAGFESWMAGDCFIHHFGSRTFIGAKIDYNESITKNWEIFKNKWNLPLDLQLGAKYDWAQILKKGFVRDKHYCLFTEENSMEVGQKAVSAPVADVGPLKELYQKVQRLVKDGRQEEAVSGLEKLLEMDPDAATAHNDLGLLYYNQGGKEKALNHYEQAVRIEPHNLTFQKNLADFYFVESGRIEDALAIYNKVLEADFGDVEALMSMGLICEALERREDAAHFYNRVLENEPCNVNALERLEILYPN